MRILHAPENIGGMAGVLARGQVDSGWSYLTGPDAAEIVKGYKVISSYLPQERPNVYGDGRAAAKVITAIEKMLK